MYIHAYIIYYVHNVCVSIIMLILITINSILYTHTSMYMHVYTHVHDNNFIRAYHFIHQVLHTQSGKWKQTNNNMSELVVSKIQFISQ